MASSFFITDLNDDCLLTLFAYITNIREMLKLGRGNY